MRFHKLNLFIYFILLALVAVAYESMTINPQLACLDDPNIRPKMPSNITTLHNLLNSLAAKGPLNGGFYNTSAGHGSDRIYGLVQCRGDTTYSTCSACAKAAAKTASDTCNDSAEVTVWNPTCWIRYSYRNFFGSADTNVSISFFNDTAGVVDPGTVTTEGMNLMSGVVVARTPNQPLMFYAVNSGMKHGMAQCTRDLSRGDCGACLETQLNSFEFFVKDKRDWAINGASCRLWYRDAQVYANDSSSAAGNYCPTFTLMSSIILLLLSLLL